MAELSVEDLSRLARNFLIGRGGEAELEDMKRAMESDPQLAMELLQQMQTALDDVAPPGFNPEQWRLVDARVAAVMGPMIHGGVNFGFIGRFFRRLFGSKGSSAASARIGKSSVPEENRVQVESPISLEGVEAPAPVAPVEGELMEEMAPIAPATSAAAPAVLETEAILGAEAVAESEAMARPAKKRNLTWLWASLGLLLLLGGAGAAYWYWPRQPKVAPMKAPLPKPLPTLQATPSGPPERAEPLETQTETLPSELPPMTPQAAGETQPLQGLEDKDSKGNQGLPLP